MKNVSSIYKNQKEILHVQYERWHALNLTSDQEHGRSTSNAVCKRLVRVCFKMFRRRRRHWKRCFQEQIYSEVP